MSEAMRELGQVRWAVAPHDHAVYVYQDRAGLVRGLRSFADAGVAANDLVVFVHSFDSDEEAWGVLRDARPDADDLAGRRFVVVSLYRLAFERRERIDYEHVQEVVSGLVEQAVELDRAALRIFVDASRRYFDGRRVDEWFAFETWLGTRLSTAAGLVCAYRDTDVRDPKILARLLATHAYRFDAPHG